MNTLNQTPEHPTSEELAAFALGKELANAETIAEHIANCPRCETLVAKMPRDTFLGILNKAKPGQSLTGPHAPKPPVVEQPAYFSPDELPEELRKQTKYTFLKKLGGGGMGVVYLAEHNLMKRKVAVKLIPPELIGNPAVRERFLREVVSAAALEHPNVVRAYSAEEFGQHMVFEMEFVDGSDLGQVVKNKGPLPVVFAVNYIRQAAQALQHGMLKSLVHRDIKPGNLMLTRAGSVKVADFGLAKFSRETDKGRDRSLTAMNATMGTPDYMAPEQARNAKTADIRADIYSLGCTFYHLLTGQPPFAGESIADLIFKHWEDARPDVGLLRNDVPAELSQYIQKMMAKEPASRPQTPKEVVDWLVNFAKEPTKKETVEKPKVETVVDAKEKTNDDWNLQQLTPEPATLKSVIKQKEIKPKKKWPMIAGAVACLLVGFAILAAAGVFKVKTKDGIIVLENLPADADVLVDGGIVTVSRDGEQVTVQALTEGLHRLKVMQGNVEIYSSDVAVKIGGEVVHIRLEPIKALAKNASPVVPTKDTENKSPKTNTKAVGPAVNLAQSGKRRVNPIALALADTQADFIWAKIVAYDIQKDAGGGLTIGCLVKPKSNKADNTDIEMMAKFLQDLRKRSGSAGDMPGEGKGPMNLRRDAGALVEDGPRMGIQYLPLDPEKLQGHRFALTIYPRRLVVVQAALPYKAQVEEIQKALRLQGRNDVFAVYPGETVPQYRGFVVQRQTLAPNGKEIEPWADLDINQSYREIFRRRYQFDEDPRNNYVLLPSGHRLAMPLPVLLGQKYADLRMPALQEAIKEHPVAASTNQAALKELPEYILVRIVDSDIVPGCIYKYRIKIVMQNPNWVGAAKDKNDVVPHKEKYDLVSRPSDADVESIESPWIEVKETVSVPRESFLFAVDPLSDPKDSKGRWLNPLKEGQGLLQIQRWISYVAAFGNNKEPVGDWLVADVVATRGTYLGGKQLVKLPLWASEYNSYILREVPPELGRKESRRGVVIDPTRPGPRFAVVEVEGGMCDYQQATKSVNMREETATEVMLMDDDGRLQVRSSYSDRLDRSRAQREEAWKAWVERTEQDTKSLVPVARPANKDFKN
jgi:serine/threonine protein kinase